VSLTNSEKAILGACRYGHSEKIDKSGFRPEYLPDPSIQKVVGACLALARRGKVVNLLNVMSLAKGVPQEVWTEVAHIWSDGFGEVDPELAMESARRDYMVARSKSIAREILSLADTEPANVEKWVAEKTAQMVSIIRQGVVYDPRLSTHLSKKMPSVLFQSLCPQLNEAMRGGFRSHALYLWAGLNKQGKTTNAISCAIDAVLQRKQVVYINTESAEQAAGAAMIYAVSGILPKEVETVEKGEHLEDSRRENAYLKWKEYLDGYIQIYDWTYLNDSRLRRVIEWTKPDLVIIDYLKRIPGRMFVSGRHDGDEVGDMSDFIANELCAGLGACVLASGQVSGDAMQKLMKKDLPSEPFILYGSKRAIDPASIYGLIKRSREPNMARFFVWHDRLDARMNTPHDIPFNPLRKIWMLEPHQKHVLEHL
jgi:hypothetical protein